MLNYYIRNISRFYRFSCRELLIVAAIIVVGVTGISPLILALNNSNHSTHRSNSANELARIELEKLINSNHYKESSSEIVSGEFRIFRQIKKNNIRSGIYKLTIEVFPFENKNVECLARLSALKLLTPVQIAKEVINET